MEKCKRGISAACSAAGEVKPHHIQHTARVVLVMAIVLLFVGFVGFELFSKMTETAVAADILSRIGII